jgi:hypothetical protein
MATAMAKKVLSQIGVLLCAIIVAGAVTPQMATAATIYVAGSGNEFGTLDLSTGGFTSIGTLNLPSGDQMFGMGFGSDGNLYGLDAQTPGAQLYQINTSNANVTAIGSPLALSAVGATADANGTMYVLSQDQSALFYTLNPPSTAINFVGSTGVLGVGLVAVNGAGTQLFASTPDPNSNTTTDLYSINPTTGAATLLGDTGGFVLGSGLFVQNTLYGFDTSGAIVTLDTTTGAGTQVATYNLGDGDFISAAAVQVGQPTVPEPSSMALSLIAAAIGSVGLIRNRRRTSGRSA